MVDKIIRLLYYILFLVTPWVMYPATSEIFEFNKMLFIYLITALVIFFWSVKMIINRKIILKKTPLDIPIVLFLLALVASTVFSIDRQTSLFGYYGRFNGGLISIVCYVLLYYGFVSNFLDIKKVLKISLISSLVVILWALPGHFGRDLSCPVFNTVLSATSGQLNSQSLGEIWTKGFNNNCWSREVNVFDPAARMFSTLGQPNWLGAYLVINFFLGGYFLIKNLKERKASVFYGSYLLLNAAAIFFTKSRSAVLALLTGGLIAGALYLYRKSKRLFVTSTVTLLLIFLVFGFLKRDALLNFLTPDTGTSNATESLDIRTIVWKGAIDLGLKYPLTGSGLETFAYSYFMTRPAAHNLTTEWDFLYNKAHNEYLNYFATAGFIGLLTYLLFIFYFIYYLLSIKKNKNDSLLIKSLSIAWLTILVTNFFGFSTTTTNLFFYLIPAMVVSFSVSPKEKYSNKLGPNKYQWVAIIVCAGLTIYVAISLVSYFSADVNYGRGVYYSNPKIGDFQKAAFYFDRALKIRHEHVYEDKLSYALAYLSGIASYQKDTQLADQLVQGAEYYNLQSLKESSKNVLYWKTRAKNKYLFYLVKGDKNELYQGIEALKAATRLSPTDPKIPYSLSVFYALLFDLETDPTVKKTLNQQAIDAVEKSLVLKKNFQDALMLKEELRQKFNP